jgi:hypothetical protein
MICAGGAEALRILILGTLMIAMILIILFKWANRIPISISNKIVIVSVLSGYIFWQTVTSGHQLSTLVKDSKITTQITTFWARNNRSITGCCTHRTFTTHDSINRSMVIEFNLTRVIGISPWLPVCHGTQGPKSMAVFLDGMEHSNLCNKYIGTAFECPLPNSRNHPSI